VNQQELLEKIKEAVMEGDDDLAVEAAGQALQSGIPALSILNDGLMAGADVVGKKFETGEYFLPQLMLTGRAIKAAMAVIEPDLKSGLAGAQAAEAGVVVLATVQTDIHDIGKNIVGSMLTASGFVVFDLGVDVPIKTIIAKAQEVKADIIGCSALLTTSMPFMRDLVDLLGAMGQRQAFKVMVGGASVTPEFSERIGADGTAPNAVQAVQLARRLVSQRRAEAGGVA
jgi:corrinoid protein of di/trimethylamine methyltransferase